MLIEHPKSCPTKSLGRGIGAVDDKDDAPDDGCSKIIASDGVQVIKQMTVNRLLNQNAFCELITLMCPFIDYDLGGEKLDIITNREDDKHQKWASITGEQ